MPELRMDLYGMLPEQHQAGPNVRKIYSIVEDQAAQFNARVEDVRAQLYIETATWSLPDWEAEYGLQTDPTLPIERRRELVAAKRRGRGTTTKAMLERVAAAFSGGEVDVDNIPDTYRFRVTFVGVYGVPANMAGLQATIEEIKPSHMAVEYVYRYYTYAELNDTGQTYEELAASGITYDDLYNRRF